MFTDICNGIGSACQWFFQFMPGFGNKPNIFFWILIAVLVITWLRMQARFNREAENDPTKIK